MKKSKAIMVSVLGALGLCACSAQNTVTKTVDAFWDAMDKGNIEEVQKLLSEDLYESVWDVGSDAFALISQAEAMDISEETQAAVSEFASHELRITYGGHEIVSIEEVSDTEYKAVVNVETADPDSLNEALAKLDYESELNKYRDEIIEIMNSEGVEAAYSRMFGIIFSWLNTQVDGIEAGLTYTEQSADMIINRDESGKWIITSLGE